MTANWRVNRHEVKYGDVYDVRGDDFYQTYRRGRVVRLEIDNTDDGVTPFVSVTMRFDDGTPDRVMHGPTIEFYLRRTA